MYNIQKLNLFTGDSISWSETFSEYPATSYSLTCYLKHENNNPIIITGSGSASEWSFSVSASETKTFPAGSYRFTYVATKTADSSKTTIVSNYITINEGLHAEQVGDVRGYWETTSDLLSAAYQNMAGNDYTEINLPNGVAVKWDRAQLLKELKHAEYMATREKRAASGKQKLRTYKIKL